MIYLIAQLSLWLTLTAAFAGLAGWAWAAERDRPARRAREREREKLLRDLVRTVGDGPGPADGSVEREADAAQRLLAVRDARIAELERQLETAKARADEAAERAAELERAPRVLEHADEVDRLRRLVAQHESERAREVQIDVHAAPDAEALSAWRLRYFEQRVKYLEGLPRSFPQSSPLQIWRMREAEARAQHLEQELRARGSAQPAAEAPAFAGQVETDALLRWRMLYLERRAWFARDRATLSAGSVQADLAEDAERWKWRARYLESRVRHLEQARAAAPAATPSPSLQEQASATQQTAREPVRRVKPTVLSGARNGAADDLTLIEGVSALQRNTLYSLGVFHFDQIAAWSREHVAWVDHYLRLEGRIEAEEWVEQARALTREGVAAARRVVHEHA